jgi:TRAP-type uncharacterized transport system fused permease subunit
MRQLLHATLAIAFWVLLVLLWVMLWVQHKASGAAVVGTAARIAICVGLVLSLTLWWVGHNLGIYRRKGPRKGRPSARPDVTADRLGRQLLWALEGGAAEALAVGHLVVELDGDLKTYRAA